MSSDHAAPEVPGATYERFLGSGGFSDVYLYQWHRPQRKVAVKFLDTRGLDDRQLEAFHAEADAMATLSDHESIVSIYSVGVTEAGRPYLVMQYCPPPDLGAQVERAPLSVREALRTGIQICGAVETAHRAGIVHRDIKPANILTTQFGRPALSDFGIAGDVQDTDGDSDIGVSVPWAPPEVLSGRSNGSVASDVYSLAATIHHVLAGRSPFHVPGDDPGQRRLLGRVLSGEVPPLGRDDVPPALERLLRQAMSKDPAERPVSALALAEGLQSVERSCGFAQTDVSTLTEDGQSTSPDVAAVPPASQTELRVPRLQAPRTVARGVTVPAAGTTGAPPSRARRQAPRPAPAPATSVRPTAPATPPEPPADREDPTTPAGRNRAWLVLGVLLAAVLGLGVFLSTLGEDEPAREAAAGDSTPRPDPVLEDVPQGQVTIDSMERTSPTQVRVRWTYDGDRAARDFFEYRAGEVTGKTKETQVSVESARGTRLCFSLHLVRAADLASSEDVRRCTR